jgi:hypothetical protein
MRQKAERKRIDPVNATRFIVNSNHVKPVNHLHGLNMHNTEEFLRLRRQTIGVTGARRASGLMPCLDVSG